MASERMPQAGTEVRTIRIVNVETGRVLAWEAQEAKHFLSRLRGRLFTRSFPAGHALHIRPCRSVHTFWMNYAIDVAYLDPEQRIVGLDHELPPGTVGKRYPGAASVVEFPAGTLRETGTHVGQALRISAG